MDCLRRDHRRDRRGRRDARPPPRAVRQADPAARARRLAAARAGELGRAGRVRRQPVRLAGHLVRRARQAVPAADPLLRRRRHQALRRRALPAAAGGLRRAPPPRRDLARVADHLRRARAVLHAGRAARTRCTAPAARIRPSRRPARRTRSRPCRTSRGSSSSPTISRRPATTRSTRRAGSGSTRPNMPYSACVRCTNCDGFPCAVHGKSDAEVLGVRPALEHPNVTLLTNARAIRARDERGGDEP